jgi:hypothetical protein
MGGVSLIDELNELSDAQVGIADAISSKVSAGNERERVLEAFRAACMATARMKDWQRRAHVEASERNARVLEKRDAVDAARRKMDSLAYKRAHLLREISASRSLTTAELHNISAATGLKLDVKDATLGAGKAGTGMDMGAIDARQEEVLALLATEEEARRTLRASVVRKREENTKLNVTGDKRRKLLEDATLKFELVSAATTDLNRALAADL